MKTFKEFREEQKKKPENMETVFGSHSVPKSARKDIETQFGSHSKPKPVLEEKKFFGDAGLLKDQAAVKPHLLTPAQHDHIHNKVAPLDFEKMSSNEQEAVHDYSDESRPINSTLHQHAKGHDVSTVNKQAYRKTIGHLDSVMRRRSTSEDMHVYTGLKHSPAKHFKKEEGKVPEKKVVHLPAFTSTSTSVKSARGFAEPTMHPNDERHGITYSEDGEARHILKIHVPKGTPAMSLKEKSFAPEEHEVLLHRGMHIEVHHQPEHLSKDTFLWHARVVGHKVPDLDKSPE